MAEEKINIATIDIDAKQFIDTAVKAKTEIDKLREANKQLRKDGQAGSKQFVENDIALKALTQTYRQSTQAASALDKATKDLADATNFEAKSVQEVTNERARFIKLSKSIKGNTDAEIAQRNKLNKIIDQQTDFIRENSSSYADNKDRVGEYRDAINSTILSNTKLGAILQQGIDIYEQSKNTINQVSAATKAQKKANTDLGGSANIVKNGFISVNGALKLFKVALISTGIGAIVVALGGLVAFLTSTQEGVDAVNSVLRPLGQIFEGLLGVLQKVGKAMFDAISSPRQAWEQLQESFKRGYDFIVKNVVDPLIASFENFVLRFQQGILKARIAWNDFTGDADEAKELEKRLDEVNKKVIENEEIIRKGAENIEMAFKKASDAATEFFNEQIERGNKLAALDIQIEEGKNRLILKEQELRTEIKRANKDAEDTTKSLAEREAAALRSVQASEQLLQAQQNILDKEIERAQLEASANDTNREAQREINELIARRGQLEEQALELQTTQTNKLNIIRTQVENERLKGLDEQIKRQQEELDLFIAQQGLKESTLKQEVKVAREVARQKRAIELQRYEAGKISETKYKTALLNIKKEALIKENELVLAEAEAEAERLEIDRLNKIASERLNFEQAFQRRQEQLEAERQLELSEAEKTGADVTLINAKYKQMQADDEQALLNQKIGFANQGLDAVAGILGKESKLAKAFSLFKAAVNLGQAISQANTVPFPANILAIGQAVATGAEAVRNIKSAKEPSIPRAERGILTGASHANGGQLIEAEGGEAIINKKSTSMFTPLLSAINQAGGGIGFAARGTMVGGQSFSGGIGATARVMNTFINYEKLGSTMAGAVSKLPAPKVAVTEIREVNDNYATVIEKSNL